MARARNIKPSFFHDAKVLKNSPLGRLLFAGLWCYADREGRLLDDVDQIALDVLPVDDADVEALLSELARLGLILRYTVGGTRLIQITKFAKHQNPHIREPKSELPGPEPVVPKQEQGAPGASTVPAPGEHHAGPADSLIPHPPSPIPHPDSPIPHPSPVATTAEDPGGSAPTYGDVSTMLRQAGVSVSSQHPTLRAWVDDGISSEQLREAVAIAREYKPPPQRIPANYLDTIVRQPAQPPPRASPSNGKQSGIKRVNEAIWGAVSDGQRDHDEPRDITGSAEGVA